MSKATRDRVKVAPGVYKRVSADGRDVYEITYRDSDGRQRRQTVHGGKRAAETALAKVKAAKGSGQRVAPMPKLTFAQAAERWMDSAKSSVRPATVNAYQSALNTHLLPAFGRMRLDRIDVDAVASLVERMQTAEYRHEVNQRLAEQRATQRGEQPSRIRAREVSTGYKPWTINGVLVPAGRIFDFAKRRLGWAGTNPVRELDRGERPKQEAKDRRILSRDELASVIEAADEPYRTIIATAATLGTRLGETLGLRWEDIDLDKGNVAIRFQIDREGKLVKCKTARSRRVVEMPDMLATMLRQHKLASAHSKPHDLVFTSRTGGPMEHRNVAQRGLAKAVKVAKLDGRPPTFHELRHAHASAWIASGGDVVELSARLGHRDPAITASTYSHEFEAAARTSQRRSRLDGLYGSDVAADVAAAEGNAGQSEAADHDDNIVDLQAKRSTAQ